VRLKKGAVKKETIGGIERHSEVLLIKAGLGSVRLSYFIVFTHWELLLKAEEGLGEAVKSWDCLRKGEGVSAFPILSQLK